MRADVEAVTDNNMTAVHLASQHGQPMTCTGCLPGHVQVLQYLSEHGAGLSVQTLLEGDTSLHLAAQHAQSSVLTSASQSPWGEILMLDVPVTSSELAAATMLRSCILDQSLYWFMYAPEDDFEIRNNYGQRPFEVARDIHTFQVFEAANKVSQQKECSTSSGCLEEVISASELGWGPQGVLHP
eukprot:239983-Amphidinium_carterae.1